MLRSIAALAVVGTILCGCAAGPGAPDVIRQCNLKYRTAPPSGDTDPKAITPIRLDSGIRRFSSGVYACLAVTVSERGDINGLAVLETNDEGFADYFSRIVVRAKFEPAKSNGAATAGRLIISSAVQ